MERRRVRKKKSNRREREKGRNNAKHTHGHTKDAFDVSGLENEINALSSSLVFPILRYCANGVSIMSSERRSMDIRRRITIYSPF